jgi:hypothetical protein
MLMKNVTVIVIIVVVVVVVGGDGLNIIPSHKQISYIQCVILDDWLNIKLCVLKCKTVVFL